MSNELTTINDTELNTGNDGAFSNIVNFENTQRMAKMLASSQLVPRQYQDNIANTVIAIEVAQRVGASPLAVMQSLYVVHGNPSWSAQFIIAALNSCGKFSPLRFDMSGTGDDRSCAVWTIEKQTGERLTGPSVSISMAKKEGWYNKNGSKWQTMPELMLRYRAATFFGRLYAPDILMGMQTVEELHDIGGSTVQVIDDNSATASDIKEQLKEETPTKKKPGRPRKKKEENNTDNYTLDGNTPPRIAYNDVADRINNAENMDQLNDAVDLIRELPIEWQDELQGLASGKREQFS